jgi:uncharacterized protein YdeI (YjbR/CyaY-like superfamily)
MNKMNPKVDAYLRRAKKWQEEMAELRRIVLHSQLTEELKWRQPCYTFQKSNVLIISGFKQCCVLSFIKGALLKDTKGILVKPGPNTQATRFIRFTNVEQIVEREPILKAYIAEAIAVEKAGLKVKLKKITQRPIPEELQLKFEEIPALKTAFRALTPGRQRAYLMHFSAAKQSKTRQSRIEKCVPRILKGKGLAD